MFEETATFKITLDEKYYTHNNALESYGGVKVKIIGKIICGNSKWHHRLLNFLTFRKYFNKYYTYNCEIIK